MISDDFRGPIGNATGKYETRNPINRALLRRFLRVIDTEIASIRPESVLDVGCGEGVVTERIARSIPRARVVGVDAADSRQRLEWGSRRLDNLSFARASAYKLPFDPGAFELVCALEVLEHLERPREALLEMARVASRGLLLSVPREPLWQLSHLVAMRNIRDLGNTPGHLNHWSAAAFRRLVSDYGTLLRTATPFPWTVAVVEV